MDETDKYKTDIDYYMELFTEGLIISQTSGGVDFDMFMDILCQDLLDTPFGGGAEIGRLGDDPDGRVVWAQHVDAGTLYPTLDYEFPVAQKVPGVQHPPVLFPRHAFNRLFYTPRPEWTRKNWGMAPPEKIYLAIEMLFRGDKYYANLLIDTPEAGVLDLLDMSKSSAKEWLESFQDLFTGADPFKVPVLYEHTTKAEWIPFGRPPTDLIFDSVTFKYAQIVCAGYGLKISDIGLSREEARTLAGVIRSERQTRRTGYAVIKSKTSAFLNRLVPNHLLFEWLDQDDETMMARGRSRLANFQAYAEAREKKMLTLREIREQIAADGLLDITVDPDDPEAMKELTADPMMGPDAVRLPRTDDRDRVPPSEGGQGQLTFPRKSVHSVVSKAMTSTFERASDPRLRRLLKAMSREMYPGVSKTFSLVEASDAADWAEVMVEASFDSSMLDKKTQRGVERKMKILDKHLKADEWWIIEGHVELDDAISDTYMTSTEMAVDLVSRTLYEEGLVDTIERVTGKNVKSDTLPSKSILGLVTSLDKQSQGLVKSAMFAVTCRSFGIPTVAASIKEGIDIEKLLADDDYMNIMVKDARVAIEEIYRSRINQLSDSINKLVLKSAITEYFTKLGLKEGEWSLEEGKLTVDQTKLFTIASKKEFQIWRNDD
jgi:hypothetical protein